MYYQGVDFQTSISIGTIYSITTMSTVPILLF